MNKIRFYIFALIFLGFSNVALTQPYKTIQGYKPYKWMFGLHWNVVEDDGSKFAGLFDSQNAWNMMTFPTKFTADKYLSLIHI